MERVLASSICCALVCLILVPSSQVGAVEAYGWGQAITIDTNDVGNAWWPAVASDEGGNAIAVWQQDNATSTSIWSDRYVFGAGWTGPVQISNNSLGNASAPDIDMDGDGDAIVVWWQGDVYLSVICANRYMRDTGWEGPENVSPRLGGWAGNCEVVCDSSGNAFVAWIEYSQIFASRYILGQGWETPHAVGADNYYNAQSPSIDMDDQGNAIVVWGDKTSATYNIWANRYTAGSGWGVQVLIESDDAGDAMEQQVAADSAGNAIAVWREYGGPTPSQSHVWANIYNASDGWGVSRLLETNDTDTAGRPRVGFDLAGNAIVVLSLTNNTVWKGVWTTRYAMSGEWSALEWIPGTDGVEPDLAVNQAGQAIVVWRKYAVFSNTYRAGFGWSDTELVSYLPNNGLQDPVVSIDRNGDAVTAWMQMTGNLYSVYVNQYVPPFPMILLTSPAEGATTDQLTIAVSGKTEPGAAVAVNGVLVSVATNGSFAANTLLKYGQNQIFVTASSSGKSNTVVVNVTCADPVPDLREELNQTKRRLNDTRDELNRMADDLHRGELMSSALMITTGIVSAMAVAMAALYLSLRRRMSQGTAPPSNEGQQAQYKEK